MLKTLLARLLKRPLPPPKDFVEWCRQPTTTTQQDSRNLDQFLSSNRMDATWETKFFEELKNALCKGSIGGLILNRRLFQPRVITGEGRHKYEHAIATCQISGGASPQLTLSDTVIRLLAVHDDIGVPVSIKRCSIADTFLTKSIQSRARRYAYRPTRAS